MHSTWHWRLIYLLAGLGLAVSLWPRASSLAELSGEEQLPGQLAGVVHWLNTAVRPQPALAPEAMGAPLAESVFAMNVFLQLEVLPEVRARSLAMVRDAGFRYVRQQFPWEDIEIHGKGDFVDRRNDPAGVDAWAKYDNIVALAEAAGVEIIARLDNPPAWSRSEPDEVAGAHGPPDDFDDYGDFVAAVAERYKGRVRFYQLWNEPNIFPEWGEKPPDPEAFTELLCIGYRRVKAADPTAVVLAGALSPTVAIDGRNMNDLIFLERMYAAGAADCFDVFSAQAYGLWSGPTDRRLRPTVINFPHHLLQRDVMVHNGDGHKPVWISEMGWNSVPETLPAHFGRVSDELLGVYGAAAYERVRREWPWVEVANYWFFKRPSDNEKGESWYYFRLLEPDFTPQPGFATLVDYATGAPAPAPAPAWVYAWERSRPWLFAVSAAVLFFGLLGVLASGAPPDAEP